MGAKKRVLVCQEDFVWAQVITETLRELGYEVVGIATSPREAYESFVRFSPQIVVLGLYLPGPADAYELMAKILRFKSTTQLLLVTSAADSLCVLRKSEWGPDALVKALE